ncbi:Oligoendopeptidase F [Staphylococcus aureus]|nr:Oligoendopeptidase F [Staphylococcus aureus]
MSQQLSREEQERKYPEYTWDLTTIFKVCLLIHSLENFIRSI